MKTETLPIRPMKDRTYARIDVEQITVLNSRDREQGQFEQNVKSIDTVGLLKPVVVNERFLERSGKYELVCGEGRLLAHKRLGKTEIEAEVISVDRKQAYLISLVENIARVPPGTMWFANEVKRMRDAGMSCSEIGRIVGKSDSYVGAYIRLVNEGEDRLLHGVERGVFPMPFALRVVEAPTADIQHLIMDAFAHNLITNESFTAVKKLLVSRLERRNLRDRSSQAVPYTVKDLSHDIASVTKEKEGFVRESARRESRIYAVLEALEILMQSQAFLDLLSKHALSKRPKLFGSYGCKVDLHATNEGGAGDE